MATNAPRTQIAKRPPSFRSTPTRVLSREQRGMKPNIWVQAGFGQPPSAAAMRAKGKTDGLGSIIDLIKNSRDMPVWNMDVIEQVRWGMRGPQTDESISANFGTEIDLFGSGKSVAGIDYVETTMAQPGQTQTYFIACYLGIHFEPAPLSWTARGNAWTVPETGVAAPPSPDVWTNNDLVDGALGAAIAAGTQAFVPANFIYGSWANQAFWHMARGYNLRWKIGQHINIMDEVLRHTAYMPPNAQEGSASSSEVEILNAILEANQRYVQLGAGLIFLPTNFVRLGSVTAAVGEGSGNVGVFSPTRDFDLVPATYGGMDLRSLLRNVSEFRRLTLPYVIKPGVPIGISFQENDTDQGNAMRAFLSITGNVPGTIPPIAVPAANINATFTAGGSGNVMLERQLDAATNTPQQVPVERATYKAGPAKISQMIKGFEVGEDWYMTMQNNPDIRDVVMAEAGIRFATQGS